MFDGVACWLLWMSCQPPAPVKPTVEIVQAAYEREAGRSVSKHDKDLQIISLDCSTTSADGDHLCWITFTSKSDKARALSFDVASVANAGGVWTLKSGLCRR